MRIRGLRYDIRALCKNGGNDKFGWIPQSSILILGALGFLAVCHHSYFPPPILKRIPAEKFKR
jgi:hypothetical protein